MPKTVSKLKELTPPQHGLNSGVSFARLTSESGPLTKLFSLNGDGTLHKVTTAILSKGSVENLHLPDFDGFLEVLPTIMYKQALTYGVSNAGDGRICTEKQWHAAGKTPGMWPRNQAHFAWPSCEASRGCFWTL